MPTRNSPGRAEGCSSEVPTWAEADVAASKTATARALRTRTPAKDSRTLGPFVVVVRHVPARLAPDAGQVLLVERPDHLRRHPPHERPGLVDLAGPNGAESGEALIGPL